MNQTWPNRILDHLELVDTQEAPHGLYGIRRAHAPEGRLPTAAYVLGAPGKAGLLTKSGFSVRSNDRNSDALSFTSGIEKVSDRYALAHYTRDWGDRYTRGFRTALHLWVPRENNAEPGAATNDGPVTVLRNSNGPGTGPL